ncbi:major facilitator superfamily domain-containing protein 8-like isoform X2 [Oscarella lobularis]|uniref:major facilitator superfamily domain-containing protein 8-like isoform X2 n=1 Tax=Oscarella lobularis TaxID=121494 RepID=UPI0033130CB9
MNLKLKKTLTYVSISTFFLMQGVEYAVIIPTLWPYIEKLGGDKSFYGLTFAAFCVSGLFSGLIFGFATDTIRKTKAAVLIGNLFEIGGNFMYMIGSSKYMVVGGRLVAGIGNGAGASIMAQLAWTSTEKERTAVFSVALGMRNLGLMLGPALNVFLREFDFHLGPFLVDKFTSSGLFMSALWVVIEIFMVFTYFDLPNIHDRNSLLSIQDDDSSGDTASQKPAKKLEFFKEYLREEIVVLLAIQFMLLFNQCSMESLVVPISIKYFKWNELDNSIFYSGAAVFGVVIFILVRYLSRHISDRWLIIVGMICESMAITLLLVYLPTMRVGVHTRIDATMFILGCVIVVFGLPFFTVGNASLFSKLTDVLSWVPCGRELFSTCPILCSVLCLVFNCSFWACFF